MKEKWGYTGRSYIRSHYRSQGHTQQVKYLTGLCEALNSTHRSRGVWMRRKRRKEKERNIILKLHVLSAHPNVQQDKANKPRQGEDRWHPVCQGSHRRRSANSQQRKLAPGVKAYCGTLTVAAGCPSSSKTRKTEQHGADPKVKYGLSC